LIVTSTQDLDRAVADAGRELDHNGGRAKVETKPALSRHTIYGLLRMKGASGAEHVTSGRPKRDLSDSAIDR
jgi:hypothetical protein